MKPAPEYLTSDPVFWAYVRLISQRAQYVRDGSVKAHTIEEITSTLERLGLSSDELGNAIDDPLFPTFADRLVGYFQHRADCLNGHAKQHLMDAKAAKKLFTETRKACKPKCPLPMNKQKGKKKQYAYLTGLVNMLIEANTQGMDVCFDPRGINVFTQGGFPRLALSRRMDGAFPDFSNPIAVWEVKEYYYTTTFGSRIADGVYITALDGFELIEARRELGIECKHILIVDAYHTWWDKGKPYLCRIIDLLHMGLLSECIFGREVVDRIPILTKEWCSRYLSSQA